MSAKTVISFLLGDRPSAFCLRFLLLLPVLTLLTLAGWFKTIVEEPLILANSWLTFWFLDLMGAQVTLNGAFIYSREFSIEVVSGCTGLFVFLFLFAAVLAFPSPWKSKGKAILLGGTLIFVLNQVRLLTLYFIGTSFPSLFDDMHVYVWQGVIIVFVAFYWYSWAVGSQRSELSGERAP